jgi:hypothetical protein
MKNFTFWDITPCSPLKVKWLFSSVEEEAEDPRNVGWLSTDYMTLLSQKIGLFIFITIHHKHNTTISHKIIIFNDIALSTAEKIWEVSVHELSQTDVRRYLSYR